MRIVLIVPIAGWRHYVSKEDAARLTGAVSLIRAPENQYDECAIEVHHNARHLGHVPGEVARFLAPLLDAGVHIGAAFGASPRRFWRRAYEDGPRSLHLITGDISDGDALRICDSEPVFSSVEYVGYLVDGERYPAHRTSSDWKNRVGRNVRANASIVGFLEGHYSFSVGQLTMPKGVARWPVPR